MELISVEDIFENDKIVITKASYRTFSGIIENTDVGIKDKDGDIEKFITVSSDFVSF